MSTVPTSPPPVVDPEEILSPATALEPVPFFARLREHEPVHWSPATHSWYLTRHDDVSELLLSAALGPRDKSGMLAALAPGRRALYAPVEHFLGKWLVFSDAPYHLRARKAIQRAFTPRALADFTGVVDRCAARAADALGEGPGDLFGDVARPYALELVCALLGIRPGERDTVLDWSDRLIAYLAMSGLQDGTARAAAQAAAQLTEFVTGTVLPRGEAPVARLLHEVHRAGALDGTEVTATFAQLLTGGAEPVATASAMALVLLLAHPDEWDAVRHGRVPYAAAVEEVLRLSSPFHFAPRTARGDLEVRGRRIAAGDRVVLVLAAANRDPEAYPDPDAFDVRRKGPRHLSFGRGGHFCLGAVLARQAVEALLRAVDDRHPTLRLGPLPLRRHPAFGVTSLAEVPCLV